MFNDQSFNDSLTNNIVSFEELGPGHFVNKLICTPMFPYYLSSENRYVGVYKK